MTRAEKSVTLCYATTRMRNGRHENNLPSRFLREIAPQYLQNPLRKEDFVRETEEEEEPSGFRFGSRMNFGQKRTGGPAGFPRTTSVPGHPSWPESRRPDPAPAPAVQTRLSVLTRPLPPKIPDGEFVPTPPDRLSAGDRIEHNRFGKGRILEITGSGLDRKARVSFDAYGEKILLLKYAKMRIIPPET